MPTNSRKYEAPLEGEALTEVCTGMMLAELAITDCKPNTLRNVCKANPWHLEALKCITGTEAQAHQPLSKILYEDMNKLQLDWELDVSGVTKGGHFLDTQGYIAHNDEMIVVSFRCTTSAFDWLANFNTTSSAWEIEEDLAQGFSGICSGLDGLCCNGDNYKPRVHTGFYNNFLAALPDVKRHVDPLLHPSEPPRKLYVVGHSLGAGIATLAGCYFMLEYNWRDMPHSLVIVTAGSPRACCNSMKELIDAKRQEFGPKQCRMYRLVKGKDVVTCVPPKIFGFCHLIDPIKITDSGAIVLRTKEDDPDTDLLTLTKYKNGIQNAELLSHENDDHFPLDEEGFDTRTKYERFVARVPRALRDHMPDFYLRPMLRKLGLRYGSSRSEMEILQSLSSIQEVASEEAAIDDSARKATANSTMSKKRKWVPRLFRSKRTAPATAMAHS